MSKHNRSLSVFFSLIGLVVIYFLTFDFATVAQVSVALIFPLACIWFSEELGNVTGISIPQINQASPGVLVAVAGWGLTVAVLTVTIVVTLSV